MDRSVFLSIKAKSLTEESKIIRREIGRFVGRHRNQKNHGYEPVPDGYFLINQLDIHRKSIVRRESRDTNIAIGFIRGKKYSDIEPTAKWCREPQVSKALTTINVPNWKRISDMVTKYSDKYVHGQDIEKWALNSVANPTKVTT